MAHLSAAISIKNELIRDNLEKESQEKTKEIIALTDEIARLKQCKEEERKELYLTQADKNNLTIRLIN
jgi:hypothetical protein